MQYIEIYITTLVSAGLALMEERGIDEIDFNSLCEYAKAVKKSLESTGKYLVNCMLNERYQQSIIDEYSDEIEVANIGSNKVYRRERKRDIEEFKGIFLYTLNSDIYNALTSEENIEVLKNSLSAPVAQ